MNYYTTMGPGEQVLGDDKAARDVAWSVALLYSSVRKIDKLE
jgi:hypothetical protein